ncbi:unnamed protein product [Dibothriocephalus latus]|uniref:PPIase FKBP-type domain-containing protein n=1 Tax=Dibothriocephalus latus TaxID=60516 RepID=A0A3P7LIP6_DIBLA|nr:unnamed protein product [Dibothriocephalus latus]
MPRFFSVSAFRDESVQVPLQLLSVSGSLDDTPTVIFIDRHGDIIMQSTDAVVGVKNKQNRVKNGALRNSLLDGNLRRLLVADMDSVLKKGLGRDSRPNHGDSVVISYEGRLEDGTVVDKESHLSTVLGEGDCIHAELKEEFELKTDSRFAYGDLGR